MSQKSKLAPRAQMSPGILDDETDGNASFLRAARAGNLEKVLEYLKGSTDINTSNANGLNALHLASKEGHVNIVTELLNRGANVDAATKKGNTALHIASLAGQEEIVKILVQQGAKVNVQSQNGFTPLYMAAQENHAEVVKFLLANGASQSLATEDGFTPLAVALQQGHDKVVAVLLENDTRGKVRLPALHIAAKKDDIKAATLLLQNEHNVDGTSKSGSLVNDTTKSGFTPLHIAAHYGNLNVGTLLIEKGADVNFKARNAITPLHVSSKWGRTKMVTLLLDNQAVIGCSTRDGLTPLHCAARSGHDAVEEILLERGAPVQAKTKNGLSPLHMAAQGDHVDCARLLLYHKAPMDEVTVDYLTPLHVAAHCGNVRTAKLLLDRKCEVNARALNGFTPLHIACKKNRIKVVELLLKYGASIEATTESGLTPLHVASFMGHMNIVIYLIQHSANPDTPTVRGETALHLAARANQTDIIRILLRNGAQVDAKAREQQTPLHIASRLGNVDIVVLLLQHGASPDSTTKDNYTPLHITAKEGHEEVAAVLLEHGASQNLTTKKGFTPLHIAAKYGNIKVVQLLLQKDADPNVQGKNGLTPLHVATHYNHVNVALLLLENGASPHNTAKNGYTPLHIAAKKNQMDIATTLLEYSAKPDAESKNGFTPLHLASQEGHTDMVSLLLEHKANVNCKAKNGLTPMHLAAQEDKVPVAEILVKYGSEIDPQTKAGYTPLHTACHFGQINMIRFLLEHDASVNATTKLGYTPLHQAAQQGHVLVINLLLKYKASPNAVTNTGQTPLSIAQRLGYISVVEVLKHITEVTPQQAPPEEKYKVVSPETMQETLMTDSEDEGASFAGEDTILGDHSMSIDDMKFLGDDSITPIKDEFQYMERFSTTGSVSTMGPDESRLYSESRTYRYKEQDQSSSFLDDSSDFAPVFAEPYKEDRMIVQSAAPALYAHKAGPPLEDQRPAMYGSYSGVSFSSSFDPDNVAPDRQPLYSGSNYSTSFHDDSIVSHGTTGSKITGFLVSFMVDARGGAMRGCRHSGVRIIVPPGKACMPTRVTCKLVKKEKLIHPPPLMEGEALASRILEMGPVGAKFQGPVIIEVPHFASLRGKEREIVILRSDNGENWREHTMEANEEAIHEALNGSFEDLESAEELYNKRITRILTSDFPHYFAVVTRIRQENKSIGPDSGMLSSTVVPQVQAVFPEGSLTKKIRVGLQAQPIQPEVISKLLGNRVAVSPIVTVEPRRRKFHKPITLTIPLPKAAQKGMINQYGGDTPTLRLLCSITGGTSPAQWEDITGTTPLTFVNDCVSFTTTVSARFWLMDCQNINEAAKMATELYREAIAVPFMAKFVVFSKRHEQQEARLRVFCMTDDKMDKTLETQEHFAEIARSRDVEVLEGKPQYVEMAGNLVPVTKSGDQLYINFHAFRENRLPFLVRVRDGNQESVGRIAFMKEPKVQRGEAPQTPICNLNVTLPELVKGEPSVELDSETAQELRRKYDLAKTGTVEDQISKAELRLTDIADTLQGDWVVLARQLNISEEEINKIQTEYTYVSEQALVMLHLWVQKNGDEATDGLHRSNVTGNELERALRKIGREDVIRKCMYNIEEVMDPLERAVAKTQIDQAGFDAFKEELGPSRDSTLPRGMSLDVSYDEQDIMKESESAGEESSEAGSVVEKRVDHYSPVQEEPMQEQLQSQDGYPVDELIERVEAIKVEGMDDRMSRSSSEESLTGRDADKDGVRDKHVRGKVKTPPPSPADKGTSPEQDVTEAQIAARLADTDTWVPQDQIAAQFESTPLQAGPVDHAPKVTSPGHELQREVAVVAESIIPDQASSTQAAPAQEGPMMMEQPTRAPDMVLPGDDEVTRDSSKVTAFGDQPVVEDRIQMDLRSEVQHRPPVPIDEDMVMPESVPEPQRQPPKSGTPDQEYDEIEETLPDGTTVRRRILKTKVKKVITKKIRRVGPDGEVIEDVITEEVPESEISETSSIRSNLSDTRDMVSPVPSLSSPGGFISPEDSFDSEKPSVRVYTDTIEGEPDVETDVQEFEEELADGTIVRRKVIKTRQKQTIVKRVVMEGPEKDLPSTEEQAQLMLNAGHVFEPDVKMYTDTTETEPEMGTDVQEFEEELDDGTIVKRKVVTTTEQQMRTERMLMEGSTIPGLIEAEGYVQTEGGDLDEEAVQRLVDEEMVEPEVSTRSRPPAPEPDIEEDDDHIMPKTQQLTEAALPAADDRVPVEESVIVPEEKETKRKEKEEAPLDGSVQPPTVTIPESRSPFEEVEEADLIEPIAKQEAARISYEETSVTIAVVEPSKDEPVVTVEQVPTGSPVAEVEESTVSFHEPVVTMVSSPMEDTKVVRPSEIDVSAGFGSLVTPEISIQAASPMVQSPSPDETSLSKGFSGVMVDEYDMEEAQEDALVQQEVAVPAEDPEKAVILRQLSEDKPDRELVKAASTESAQSTISEEALGVHRHLEASSSMEVHRDSQPPSDLDSQSSPHEYDHRDPWRSMEDADGHIDEEVSEDDRPLSPTEYILEPEADGDQEPDGRLGADTSQQIFIEQSIEKQRSSSVSTPPDERPPSPSDFTLVTDETRDVADMYDAERPSGQPQLTPDPCSDDLMQDTVTLTEGVLVEDDETTPDHTTSIITTSQGSASPPKPTSLITTTVPQIERSEESMLVFTPPQTTVAPMLVPDNVYLDSGSSMSSEPAVIQTYEQSGEATMSTLSSDNMEADVMIEREVGKLEAALEPVQQYEDFAAMEECHRLRASSFEDIYTETNLEYEHSSMIPTDGLEIGDRFDTRHADLHLMTQANRSSSFENIETAYKETMKEAASKDEKDIDERERIMIELEAELGRKEKGAEEGEKESPLEPMHQAKKGMVVDEEALEKAEEYDNFDVDEPLQSMPMEEPYETPQIEEEEPPYVAVESEEDSDSSSPIHKAAPAPGQLQKYPSPIDLTFESGLDHVGQEDEEETLAAAPFPDSDRESLERSQSYEASYDLEALEDLPQRQRHYSSPDEVMHRESLEDIRTTAAAAEKDTWDAPAEEDPMSTSSSEMARLEDVQFSKEHTVNAPASFTEGAMADTSVAGQVVSTEGELDEAAGGDDVQTTRLVMKKQVHKKTIIRDGKEEVLVTEDTHIEQDNEGPEELRDSMQQVIDQFMVGGEISGVEQAQLNQS